MTNLRSKQMDRYGNINILDENFDNKPIFRKYFNFHDISYNERAIVKFIKDLKDNQLFVKIFTITDNYYDAELLDLDYKDYTNKSDNIIENIKALNAIGIIYIDIKSDNIGYSHIHKRWKLFDFDCSGIIDLTTQKWIIEAPFYYNYQKALKLKDENSNFEENKIKIDEILLNDYLKQI